MEAEEIEYDIPNPIRTDGEESLLLTILSAGIYEEAPSFHKVSGKVHKLTIGISNPENSNVIHVAYLTIDDRCLNQLCKNQKIEYDDLIARLPVHRAGIRG